MTDFCKCFPSEAFAGTYACRIGTWHYVVHVHTIDMQMPGQYHATAAYMYEGVLIFNTSTI